VLKASRLVQNAWIIMAIGFGLVVLAMIAVALLVVRSQEADALVDHTFEVQSTAQSLLSQVQAAENGQRGFLITGDEDYLKPSPWRLPGCQSFPQAFARSRPTTRGSKPVWTGWSH